MKAAVVTLGCRLNQADSALIQARLEKMGIETEIYEQRTAAEILVVNSCAVTASASRKSRQTLRALRARHPEAVIVMTGCAATVEPERCSNPEDGADLILDNESKKDLIPKLAEILEKKKNSGKRSARPESGTRPKPEKDSVFSEGTTAKFTGKSRANLKIQEGCSNFCSYCIVPYARGPERSRDFNESVEDFRRLLDSGFHEIALTGINICTYSCGGKRLPDLLEKLLGIPGDFRLRLGSLEPGETLSEILPLMAESHGKICNFLHPSLQHGSDAILKSMNRHYLTALYLDFAQKARAAVPDLHIGTDLIVGFPGETEELFEESYVFLEKIQFSNIHIFPYSPRPGTPAAGFRNQVPGNIVEKRIARLDVLREKSMLNWRKTLIGTMQTFIPETVRDGISEGWTGNYVRAKVPSGNAKPGELFRIRIQRVLEDGTVEGSR